MATDRYRDPRQLYILSALLAFPEDDALDALRDLLPVAPWLSPAIEDLAPRTLEQWQGEHTRLFLSGYPKTPCPPSNQPIGRARWEEPPPRTWMPSTAGRAWGPGWRPPITWVPYSNAWPCLRSGAMRRRFLGSYGARICNAGSPALPGISRSMVRLNSTACWGRGWKGSVGRWKLPDKPWVLCPPELAEDDALSAAVLEVHQAILRDQLQGDPSLNPDLDIQQRALRRVEDWRVLLLLTPWMLARLLFPDRSPSLALPGGWSAPERTNAPYQVLGPRILFSLLGQSQQAHLSYHRDLGHFLLQPLCLDMEPYPNTEAVFEAWGQVIRTRDENMEKARRDCPLQKEVSRRELFARFRV
jgi:hypothetical protein